MSRTPLADFVTPLTLSVPERLVSPPSWMGHTPFAFWIVEALRPRVLVELGVHSGVSYCAFCQAEQALGGGGRYYGVDHWKGDEHAGEYAEEVYRDLSAWHDPRFADFSSLVRSGFDEAVDGFSDGEIDLLHIDGLHTYEAVRHDFDTWKDKVSGRGVALFHDIAVRKDDFGVWKFWKEVEGEYPSLGFQHSNGLGVLAIGDDLPAPVRNFFDTAATEEGAAELRRLFSRLGAGIKAQYGAGQFEKDELVPQRNHIRNLEDRIESLQSEIARAHENAAAIGRAAEERMLQITDLKARLEIATPDRERVVELTREAESLRAEALSLAQRVVEGDAARKELDRIRGLLTEAERELTAAKQTAKSEIAEALDAAAEAEEALEDERRMVARLAERLAVFDRLTASGLYAAAETAMQQLASEATDRARLHAELQRVRQTVVWKLGGPFRVFGRRFPSIARPVGKAMRALLSLVTLRFLAQARSRKRSEDQRAEDRFLILESGLFQEDWYAETYPDAANGRMSLVDHYLKYGAAEGRDPNPWFDSDWYLAANPDVVASGRNPLAHYALIGESEGRAPSPLFAVNWYRASGPGADNGSALAHFIATGREERRPTHPLHTLRAVIDSAKDSSAVLAETGGAHHKPAKMAAPDHAPSANGRDRAEPAKPRAARLASRAADAAE